MTGNHLMNMKFQNYFLNACASLSIVLLILAIYSVFV